MLPDCAVSANAVCGNLDRRLQARNGETQIRLRNQMKRLFGCTVQLTYKDVLQLSKSGKRAIGRVDRAPSHAATSNSLLMN